MYALALKHASPLTNLKQIAKTSKVKVQNDNLIFENKNFIGCAKAMALENLIQCLYAKYYCYDDFELKKNPALSEFFILRINEISINKKDQLCDIANNTNDKTDAFTVFLLRSLEEFNFSVPKGSLIKTIEFKFSKEFFLKQLNMTCSYEMVKEYLSFRLKNASNLEYNYGIRNLFVAISNAMHTTATNKNYIQQKTDSLFAIFFSEFNYELYKFIEAHTIKISNDEVGRLMIVRKHLDQDILPSSLESLSKIALMSGTSLKTKFKKLYGITVFEYIQKQRMQKARILLLTQRFSVKQVGQQLGYVNLSNFSIAFKKEFHLLPKQLIK